MSATATTKGLLGTKLGMTQVWDENNKLVPVTVVSISPNVVTQVRNVEKDERDLWRDRRSASGSRPMTTR